MDDSPLGQMCGRAKTLALCKALGYLTQRLTNHQAPHRTFLDLDGKSRESDLQALLACSFLKIPSNLSQSSR